MKPRLPATTSIFLLSATILPAQTWDGGGANDNLTEAANWNPNGLPSTTSDVIFAGIVRLTPNVASAFQVNSLTFDNTAGAFAFGGVGTLGIKDGGLTNNDTQTQTIGNPVNFGLSTVSSINAASGGLTLNGSAGLGTATVTLSGANPVAFGSTLTGAGTLLKTGGGTLSLASTATAIGADLTLNAGTTTLAAGTAQTFNSGSTITLGGGSLTLNESAVLDGGQFTRSSGALGVAAGKTLTVQNGADLVAGSTLTLNTPGTITVTGAGSTFSGSTAVLLNGGVTLGVAAGGSLNSTGTISLATSTNGTMTVDGAGSSMTSTLGLFVGQLGGDGTVTLSNGSSGSVGGITVASSTGSGTIGILNVQSGSTLTGTNLQLANLANAHSGTVTIDGAGSALTLSGVTVNNIGAASLSTGTLNVQNGGVFSSNTGTLTVSATGAVNLNGGTVNLNGSVVVNGGQLNQTTGGFYLLAGGKSLTVQGGGDLNFATADLTAQSSSIITLTGVGTTYTGSFLTTLGAASLLQVNAGAVANIGANGSLQASAGAVLVDGAGSQLNSAGTGNSLIGDSGSSAVVTYLNGATGSFNGTLSVANNSATNATGTLNVQSGADLTPTHLAIAATGTNTTGTVTVTGAGSTITQSGAGILTIGKASSGNGTLNVNSGAIFTTGTAGATVHPTGTLALGGGSLSINGNLHVDGGQLSTTPGSGFNQLAGTFTVSNGGDAAFSSFPSFGATAAVAVTGPGSSLTSNSSLTFDGDLAVTAGGTATTPFFFDIGLSSPATALIDGSGSSVISTSSSPSIWGGSAGTTAVTFSNNATGSFGSGVVVATVAGSNTTLNILGGADVTTPALRLAETFTNSAAVAVANVGGSGSTFSTTSGPLSLGEASGSSATLNITSGGTVSTVSTGGNHFVLNPTGTANLNGGSLILGDPLVRNGGVLNFNSGLLSLDESLTIGPGGLLGENVTLAANRQLVVGPSHATTIDALQTFTLDGGALTTGSLAANGAFDFRKGSLALTGAGGFDIGSGALGSSVTLALGAHLTVANTTTVAAGALLRVDGGSFSGADVNNSGTIDHRDGALGFTGNLNNAAGSRLFVGGLAWTSGNINNAGRITLQNGIGEIGGTGTLANSGLITGDGTIARAVTNGAGGQLRAESGKTLAFTGLVAPNAGTFSLQGGMLEFAGGITNGPTGFISGRGAIASVDLANQGVMAFSGGYADVFGDVFNDPGARIVTSGAGSVTTFWDDVTHNGLEIHTGAACSTVFYGAQSGAGPFTGTGTVYFTGDLQPGNSPAAVTFGGGVVLGFLSRTTMEIGGTTPGSQHDRLVVSGALDLAGDLEIELINGFGPQPGQSFDLFDAATLTGGFTTVTLPPLAAGRFWRADTLAIDGVLAVGVTPATFAEFAAAYGLLTGPGGDDDGDGSTNALEFLFGTHPGDGASVPRQAFTRTGPQSEYEIIIPEITGATSTYAIESSPDLATWTTLATKTGAAGWSGGAVSTSLLNGYVTVTLEETDAAPKRFYRTRAALE